MFLPLNKFAQFSIAASVVLLTTMGANLAPARAALLNFSFTTEDGGNGSFKLNTAVADTIADDKLGFYSKAIADLTFNGSLLLPVSDVLTNSSSDGNGNKFTTLSFNSSDFTTIGLQFEDNDGKLINQLSSSPSDYKFLTGYFDNTDGISLPIVGATVTGTAEAVSAVPEPGSTISILALGALGAGALAKRRIKGKENLEMNFTAWK